MPHTNTQPPLPFQAGSETSRDAAVKASAFAGSQDARVLALVRKRGAFGVTQKEAEAALGIGRPSLCQRFRGLEQRGEIRNTRKIRGGCCAYVAATAQG